jgi:hypothetical protein
MARGLTEAPFEPQIDEKMLEMSPTMEVDGKMWPAVGS